MIEGWPVFRGDIVVVRTDSLSQRSCPDKIERAPLIEYPIPASQLLISQVPFDLIVRHGALAISLGSP